MDELHSRLTLRGDWVETRTRAQPDGAFAPVVGADRDSLPEGINCMKKFIVVMSFAAALALVYSHLPYDGPIFGIV